MRPVSAASPSDLGESLYAWHQIKIFPSFSLVLPFIPLSNQLFASPVPLSLSPEPSAPASSLLITLDLIGSGKLCVSYVVSVFSVSSQDQTSSSRTIFLSRKLCTCNNELINS